MEKVFVKKNTIKIGVFFKGVYFFKDQKIIVY